MRLDCRPVAAPLLTISPICLRKGQAVPHHSPRASWRRAAAWPVRGSERRNLPRTGIRLRDAGGARHDFG